MGWRLDLCAGGAVFDAAGVGSGSDGIEGEKVVPLCFKKSKWAAVALLGVMKSGAAFSLTDPSQPEARLRTIVKQTAAILIITYVAQGRWGRKLHKRYLLCRRSVLKGRKQAL